MTSSSTLFRSLVVCLALFSVSAGAYSENPDLFSHEQEVIIPEGEHEYYSIELSGLQYRNAQPDMADIRVRDSRGVYCPYVLNSSRNEETSEQLSYQTTVIGVVTETINDIPVVHYDFQVVDFSDDGEVNTIVMETDAVDFSCRVRLFARTARSDWLQIATDTVYRLDDVVKLSVELDEMHLYQFWRISVDDPSPLTMLSITPRLDRKRSESRGFLKEIALEYEVVEKNRGGRTILNVKNPDRLYLVSLNLETGDLFKRMVEILSGRTRLASKQLYRLPSGGDQVADTTIEPYGRSIRDESFEIIIENRDDEPLSIERITAEYRIDYLVFKPSGYPPYSLVYGNRTLGKPVYDLASYKDEVLARNIPDATLAAPVIRTIQEQNTAMGKTLFTVIVITSAAVLFALSIVIFLKKPGSPR